MKASNESKDRKRLHPPLALFKKLFNIIYTNRKFLSQQLEKAQAEYPELMFAYKLTSIYSRFLERSFINLSRRMPTYTPLPDGDYEEGIITWPPEPEPKDIFQQLKEFVESELAMGDEIEAAFRHDAQGRLIEWRNCTIVRQEYETASSCVMRYLDNPPETDEQWNEFNECIDKLSRLIAEMQSLNCSF